MKNAAIMTGRDGFDNAPPPPMARQAAPTPPGDMPLFSKENPLQSFDAHPAAGRAALASG